MGTIIPENALNSKMATPGEKRLLFKLKDVLPDDCLVWYEPQLKGARRPDLIIFAPKTGLIIYEVKDWKPEHIRKLTPDTWTVNFDGVDKNLKSPLRQAEEYFRILNASLEKRSELCNQTGESKGKLKFPIGYAAVFTNIRSQKFLENGWDTVLETAFALFQDDLAPSSNNLPTKIKNHFKVWFQPVPLSDKELAALRGVLYPEIISVQNVGTRRESEVILDLTQEQIAKRIPDEGHTIIHGVAGSGKSLVLCAKARLLATEHPEWNILLTCYNKALSKHLRAYIGSFQNLASPALSKNINVTHFHALCARHNVIINYTNKNNLKQKPEIKQLSKIEQIKYIDEMYDNLCGNMLSKKADLIRPEDKYNVILVDEAQDFHYSWLRALTRFLKHPDDIICLAEDPHQKIYTRKFRYSDVGIDVVGRHTVRLPINYRSTLGIVSAASKFITEDWSDFLERFHVDKDKLRSAKYPDLITCSDHIELIITDIKRRIAEGYEFADCAVMSPSKTSFCTNTLERFKNAGLPVRCIDEIQSINKNENSISFTTIASSKGLEFENVYCIGLEQLPMDFLDENCNDALIYVAMTRAKNHLMLFAKHETKLIDRLRNAILNINT